MKGNWDKSFLGVGTNERRVGKREGRMKVYVVDVFCIHIRK
jgi:hypothetical protein